MTVQFVPAHGSSSRQANRECAPDLVSPVLLHLSLSEATEEIPEHHVPSLTRLCRDRIDDMIADPRDLSALIGLLKLDLQYFPADIHLSDPLDKKPSISLLECACTIGTRELVKYLVEDRKQIPDINCLERAAGYNDIAVLEYVCRHISPDVQIPDPLNKKPTISPMEYACSIGTLELVKYLVEERNIFPDFSCLERASSHVDIA